mmetsp:Transcript_32138/g.30630  ORF Transcript_32138/g.30630 Transcript_32138/m.30630 type:complete len:167 (+) Transcript_32138:3-503(+)
MKRQRMTHCKELRLLVVDDSALNRKMLCKLLVGRGHLCDEAKHGKEAVAKMRVNMGLLEDGPGLGPPSPELGPSLTLPTCAAMIRMNSLYDALLMDSVMPIMDGPTATKIIRGLGYTGVIIGVTGNALPSDIDHFIAHGADRVLTKPMNINDFNTIIKEFADRDTL